MRSASPKLQYVAVIGTNRLQINSETVTTAITTIPQTAIPKFPKFNVKNFNKVGNAQGALDVMLANASGIQFG